MKYLIYVSHSKDINNIQKCINKMRDKNNAHDVTGILVINDGLIMQLIEGTEMDIDALWTNIQKDPRHYDIKKIKESHISNRLFANWNIRLVTGTGYKNYTSDEDVNKIFNDFNQY